MSKQLNIAAAAYTPDPIVGTTKQKNEHFFQFEKVVHSKDDTAGINKMLKRGGYFVSGKEAFNDNGDHVGFKCSAKCRPDVALGHNRRDKSWVEDLEHIDFGGYSRTYLDCGSLEKCYEQIFGEALEEYNKTQRNDRKIKNYLTHILEDQRRGSMKKKSTTDNSRKPWYEFIFQIGKRDNRLDTEASIAILEKFVLEWMPEHYPNLKAVGIYLHADEFTIHPVTHEKLPGSVHIHFDFVPVCHALTKEEQEEEDKLREEIKQQEIERCKKEGIEFDEKKWKKKDWTPWRVEHFGKALQSGMSVQSSISGACAEMGFRTKGKLTAQIQMEEAVRNDLLDMVESYGIKIDREIELDREEEVTIQLYKAREDNAKLLEANQKLMEELQKQSRKNKRDAAQNLKDKNQNQLDKTENEKNAKHNAEEKAVNDKKSAELSVFQNKVDMIDKNLEKIDKWTSQKNQVELQLNKVNEVLNNQKKQQDKTEKKQNERQKFLDELHDETFAKADENERKEIEIKNQLSELKDESQKDDERKKEIKTMVDDYYSMRTNYRKYEDAHYFMERTDTDIDKIEKEFYQNEKYGVRSFTENLTDMFGRVKEYINHLYLKFEDAQRVWNNYFHGKKAEDLRSIASDMDAHGITSFDDYDKQRLDGKLSWQIKKVEEEKQRMIPKKKERPSISWDD